MLRGLLLVVWCMEVCRAGLETRPGDHVPTIDDKWGPFGHPIMWRENSDFIESLLGNSAVNHIEFMDEYLKAEGKVVDFSNQVLVVHLSNGMKAVFKPDLEQDGASASVAEVAAYRASILLGFPFVPPTILRTIDIPLKILRRMNVPKSRNCQKTMKGSLQLLVKTDIDLLRPDDEYGNYRWFVREIDVQDDARLRIFYFIFGQWDNGQHNLLAFDDGRKLYPIAIDNAGIRRRQYAKFGEHPFVEWVRSENLNTNDLNEPFPFDSVECIEISEEERIELKKGSGEGFRGRLRKRLREKLEKRFESRLPDDFYETFNCYNVRLCYVVYNNALWRQYHASDDEFIKAFSDKCDKDAISAIAKINLEWLRKIFHESSPSFNDQYFEMILERRDQVLNYYGKMHNTKLENVNG